MSCVTGNFFSGQTSRAIRLRVCYQRGLPRLDQSHFKNITTHYLFKKNSICFPFRNQLGTFDWLFCCRSCRIYKIFYNIIYIWWKNIIITDLLICGTGFFNTVATKWCPYLARPHMQCVLRSKKLCPPDPLNCFNVPPPFLK